MWGVTVLVLVLVAGASNAADATEKNDDGFRVESSEPDDYRGTRKDVESNITDELAVKLRQFDEWTVDSEEHQAAATTQGGAARGDDGADASDRDGRQAGAEATGSDSDGDLPTAGDTHAALPGSEDTTVAARPGDLDSTRAVGRSTPQPALRADRRAEEDDVARMIREAAEQETDPERRKALMEQYDAYLENR